jgi:hypothetical protein
MTAAAGKLCGRTDAGDHLEIVCRCAALATACALVGYIKGGGRDIIVVGARVLHGLQHYSRGETGCCHLLGPDSQDQREEVASEGGKRYLIVVEAINQPRPPLGILRAGRGFV